MIVSHKHKFIFLKTKKTAGTSIQIALSKFCGKDDIITPFKGDDKSEILRRALGYREPQNYKYPKLNSSLKAWLFYTYYFFRLKPYSVPDNTVIPINCKELYSDHSPAKQVRKYLGEEVWNSYFKFSFERNPFEKVISYYHWVNRDNENPVSLSDFIKSRSDLGSSFYIYGEENNVLVDYVGMYEKLDDELAYISERINLPINISSLKTKSEITPRNKSYKDLLSEEDIKKIKIIHAREIAHFGFKY